MRAILVALAILVGCGDDIVTMPDGGVPPDAPVGDSFHAPVGARCDVAVSTLCAEGFGACWEGTCRAQCHEGVPRCPTGTTQVVGTIDGHAQCVCIP